MLHMPGPLSYICTLARLWSYLDILEKIAVPETAAWWRHGGLSCLRFILAVQFAIAVQEQEPSGRKGTGVLVGSKNSIKKHQILTMCE